MNFACILLHLAHSWRNTWGACYILVFDAKDKTLSISFWETGGPNSQSQNPISWHTRKKNIWKLLVIAFRRYMTLRGPRTFCDGPEMPTQWKSVSVTDLLTYWPLTYWPTDRCNLIQHYWLSTHILLTFYWLSADFLHSDFYWLPTDVPLTSNNL